MFNAAIFIVVILFSQTSVSNNLESCGFFTKKYNSSYKLPNKLLTSISLVESGLKRNNKLSSWPWTLNVNGKSMYFDNKEEAIEHLKKSLKINKNIDIGCMQINYQYHGKNFRTLEDIIDPNKNVKYAASFLRKLFKKHKSWNEAISRYHSSKPKRKKRYLAKVQSFWNDLRQRKIKIDEEITQNFEERKIEYFRNLLKEEKLKI
jgi:hypothetical protein